MLQALRAYAGTTASLSTGSPVSLSGATTAADSFLSSASGSGAFPPASGFVGQGPFWTCGSPTQRARAVPFEPDKASSTPAALTQGFMKSVMGGCTGASAGHAGCVEDVPALDVGGKQSAAIMDRLSGAAKVLLANAIDIPLDSPPPEDELTTLSLETKEQRSQWRDFLSE